MKKKWSEVQEVIDILKILQNNNIDLQYILENPYVKLKDIDGAQELIRENKWESELSIGRALLKIKESAKFIKANKSRGNGYNVSQEQIDELISLGLITEEELQYDKKEPYRRANTGVKQDLAVDKLIHILKILKKYNFRIETLPRSSKKLQDIKGLTHIIYKEDLDPLYNIGRALEQAEKQIRYMEMGKKNKKTYIIPPNRMAILKDLGMPFSKRKNRNNNEFQGSEEQIGDLYEDDKAMSSTVDEDYNRLAKDTDESSLENNPQEILSTEMENPIDEIEVVKNENVLLEEITPKGNSKKTKETATDKLMKLLDLLEAYSPGISLRLPKASTKLGDIKELSEIIELLGLSVNQKIDIGATVSKAKALAIGRTVDRVISKENINTLKKYGLLTDEEIEAFRKREKGKVNGKVKYNSEILVEVLEVLINNDVDILDLPRSSKKIGEIYYLKDIVDKEKLDKNYDIGLNIGTTVSAIKKILAGEKSHYVVSDENIKKMREWGFATDWDVEKYKKQITSAQELIIICRKLQKRGINIQALKSYEIKIGDIQDIKGLKQIIQEEQIPERYEIGNVMRAVLDTAKTMLLETENPDYKQIRNIKFLKVSNEDIQQLRELGILTDESMDLFRKRRSIKLNEFLAKKSEGQYELGNSNGELDKIMRDSVAQHVKDNEKTRRQLAELVVDKGLENSFPDK